MKTSNPALSANTFRLPYAGAGESMTISGAVNKTGILLVCAVLTAAWSWNRFTVSPETAGLPLMIGLVGGLIVALVTIFKKEWAPVTAPFSFARSDKKCRQRCRIIVRKTYDGLVIRSSKL